MQHGFLVIISAAVNQEQHHMKTRFVLVTLLTALVLTGVASVHTGYGTLGINATVQGSMNLTFLTDASVIAVAGTSTAFLPLVTESMYGGTVPANVARTA
jgi:hypothetical protein